MQKQRQSKDSLVRKVATEISSGEKAGEQENWSNKSLQQQKQGNLKTAATKISSAENGEGTQSSHNRNLFSKGLEFNSTGRDGTSSLGMDREAKGQRGR